MEKLQKALQKARDQRAAGAEPAIRSPAVSGIAAPTVGDVEGVDDFDSVWNKLKSTELDHKLLNRNLLVTLDANQKATPFDILRTKAQILMQKNGWSRLGITSPTAACGKTTTALNVGLGFTRQSDLRVILIEFDLRRPNIARALGHSPEKDITEMLCGDVPFAEQAVRVRDNLAISMARHSISDPTSVMTSKKTHATLADIERRYAPDLMIFDLPPVLFSDDTRAFLKELDCALIIAKSEATSVAQIDACEREVAEHTNVLGVVLNQCRHTADTDYGYDSYSYGS
jgi:Mrp family chromosome partitioning ATPase